jgi:hypothetical protein
MKGNDSSLLDREGKLRAAFSSFLVKEGVFACRTRKVLKILLLLKSPKTL